MPNASTDMFHFAEVTAADIGASQSKTTILPKVLCNNNPVKDSLFDGDILKLIQLNDECCKLPANLVLRPLNIEDRSKGYLELLKQLTVVGHVSKEDFVERFRTMSASNPTAYYVIVIEDTRAQRVIGTITLVIELKFIHSAGIRGRVEDLVVDSASRGMKLGKILSLYAVELARLLGVYKLSLECKDSLMGYYEKFGYIKDPSNNFMVQRFDGTPVC